MHNAEQPSGNPGASTWIQGRSPVWSGVTSGALFLAVMCLLLAAVFQFGARQHTQIAEERLKLLASAAAQLVDHDLHQRLQRPEQTGSEEYQRAVDPLVDFHNSVPDIYWLYTMRVVDGALYYVLDTARSPRSRYARDPDLISSVLDPVTDFSLVSEPGLLADVSAGRVHLNERASVYGGRLLHTASAPVYDSAGQLVAILAVDLEVSSYVADHDRFTAMIGLAAAASLLIAVAIGLFTSLLHRHLRRVMRELQQLQAELEHRVLERTAELDLARRAAERASAAKSMFLATMSHEMRTPLGALLGTLELLARPAPPREQAELLDSATDAGRGLLRIIDDVLDQTSLDAGTLALRPAAVSIEQLLRRSHALHQAQAAAKGLTLTTTVDPRISPALLADPQRLAQVLGNLVSNAIKFTASGAVAISAELIARGDGAETLRLAVRDSGIGIADAARNSLFDRSARIGEDNARLTGGTGLGLSISRDLVQLMGGAMAVHSEPGQGSTFSVTLTLPVAAAVSESAPEPESARLPGAGALALGVDDHPDNRKLLARQLALLGLQVQVADGGAEALALWQSGAFRVLLADVNMPGMDGYALTRAVREIEARDALPRTPVIAWTANVLPETVAACLAAGMDEVLTKPTALEDLRAMLNKWLQVADSVAAEVTAGAESAAVPAPPAVLAVDVRVLEALVGDDPAVVREFLSDFRTSAVSIAAALQHAGEQGATQQAGALAHKLKSSSRSIGALALGELCAAIEQAAREGFLDTLGAALAQLALEMPRVIGCIDGLLNDKPCDETVARGAPQS